MFRPLRARQVAALAFALISPTALAGESERGTVTITGNGLASAAPERVEISVSVISLCYDTSRAAKDANAILANEVLAKLRSFMTDERDEVTASGGPNVRQTEYSYVGSETRVLCEMKWRATNVLTLKTTNMDAIPDIQDATLAVIDEAVDAGQTAQTYANLSQPSFSLFPDTMKRLKAEAQDAAVEDAKTQFRGFASLCDLADTRLTTIAPPEVNVYPRRDGMVMDSAMGSAETPVIPEDIAVQAKWQFVWSFAAGGSCPRPS